jgi:hypothetical protein
MPLSGSVGNGGTNRSPDVRIVQVVLNEWRAQNGFRPIAVDGMSGPETISAISAFQDKVTKIVDGRIDPNGPSWRALVAAHNEMVRSFIVIHSKKILDYLDENIRKSSTKLPQHIGSGLASIRADIMALGPPVIQLRRETSSRGRVLGFAAPPPVIGLVIADDVVILIIAIFVLLIMWSIIIAKPALEELVRQLLILMSKIKKFIEDTIEAIKDIARNNIRQFQKCKGLFDQLIALAAQILVDLEAIKHIPPGDELGRRRAVEALATKLQRFQNLLAAFFLCMGVPQPTPLLG